MKVIDYVFHFPPSEIWLMDSEELTFWKDAAYEFTKDNE